VLLCCCFIVEKTSRLIAFFAECAVIWKQVAVYLKLIRALCNSDGNGFSYTRCIEVVLVWHSGDGIGHINRVKLRWAQFLLVLMTFGTSFSPGIYLGPLSLVIPPWPGAMITGIGVSHCWGRNGKFCIIVGSVTGTADILVYCMPA